MSDKETPLGPCPNCHEQGCGLPMMLGFADFGSGGGDAGWNVTCVLCFAATRGMLARDVARAAWNNGQAELPKWAKK